MVISVDVGKVFDKNLIPFHDNTKQTQNRLELSQPVKGHLSKPHS